MTAKLLNKNAGVTLKTVYCETLIKMMRDDPRIMQIEADLSGAMKTGVIREAFPDRYINCGVMEAQMVGLACGMSVNGIIPYVHSFAAFASRRVADQVFMSGCYNDANVKLIGSDPGVCAEYNGGTHQCLEDMGIMRSMAGMSVLDVADPRLLASVLVQMRDTYGMMYLRMPRNNAVAYYAEGNEFRIGRANLLRDGNDVSIIASGICVIEALHAAEILSARGINAQVVDMFTVKPIDSQTIADCAKKTGCIVTVENHNINGGLGSAVAEALCENSPAPMVRLGAKDRFGEVGDQHYLARELHIIATDIVDACERAIRLKRG